jgi:hypothetical protein
VSIPLANGAGGFLARARVAADANPRYVAIADVNRDGHADVAPLGKVHSVRSHNPLLPIAATAAGCAFEFPSRKIPRDRVKTR